VRLEEAKKKILDRNLLERTLILLDKSSEDEVFTAKELALLMEVNYSSLRHALERVREQNKALYVRVGDFYYYGSEKAIARLREWMKEQNIKESEGKVIRKRKKKRSE